MLSKNLENSYRIFWTNRYMVICLLLSVILMLPLESNAQWMPGIPGYGVGLNPMQGLLGLGYSSFANPLQYMGGFGFGMDPMQAPLGYGLFGSQMQYPTGYGLGVNPVIEPFTDKRLISKINGLGNGKTAQISRSDELLEYYLCKEIPNNMVPPPAYKFPYQVDTNDVIGIVKCLLDKYKFVFVSKAEVVPDKFLVVSNDTSYTPSPNTTSYYGGLPTYPAGAFYGGLGGLNVPGSIFSPYLTPPLAYSGIGGLLGDFAGYAGYGAIQYPGQRINETYPLPDLSTMFTKPLYGNLAIPPILGNIPLYGRPTVIPSEIPGNNQAIIGEPPRNGHFAPFNPGLSYSMNLMTTPSQSFPHPLF